MMPCPLPLTEGVANEEHVLTVDFNRPLTEVEGAAPGMPPDSERETSGVVLLRSAGAPETLERDHAT